MTLQLNGLDGANPLGFLAALGLCRILARALAEERPRFAWTASAGTWVLVVHLQTPARIDQERLLAILQKSLVDDIARHPAAILEDLGSLDDPRARRALFQDALLPHSPTDLDWLSALAADSIPREAINQIQTARRDYFFGNIVSVIRSTNSDHLRRALFHSWDYADPLDNQSLHFDPSEDRRHAYQWNKPAGDPDRKKFGGMLGANRLALEAIPLLTSLPVAGNLRTIGFTGNRSTNTRWTWPIWNRPVSLDVLRSLLSLAVPQRREPSTADLRNLREAGIVALYRTRRILVGKTPNFTPPRRIA